VLLVVSMRTELIMSWVSCLQHAEGFFRDEVDEFHTQKEKVSC